MELYYKKEIAAILKKEIPLSDNEIIDMIGKPPKKDMGDYAFPCFTLAKTMKKAPPKISADIVPKLESSSLFDEIKAVGPYINFFLNKKVFIQNVLKQSLNFDKSYFIDEGQNKKVVVEYSSPNIAKPFSIAHLRSTSIGNSLSRIYQFLGYEVIRINHLGDWGTSFGKLITAYKKWGKEEDLVESPIKNLLELYVLFHKESDQNPDLEDEARQWFKKLEDGDEEAVKLWTLFKNLSLEEFKRMYDLLDTQFDYYWGESFYQEHIDPIMDELNQKNLTKESKGAVIVDLEQYDLATLMLKKQDGATLYATRDIAAAIYRMEKLNFDQMIYVVGGEQELHFKQFLKVIELMGHHWVDRCHHVGFGLIQFKDGKMSTREGKIIFLEDVINRAKELALEKLNEAEQEKPENERLSHDEKEKRALKLGISSVVFSDLKNGRQKDVAFDWEEILNPKGETGVYLQYAHARLCGIIRNFEKRLGEHQTSDFNITEENSFDIAKVLSAFKDKIIQAANSNEPSVVARYLLDLGQAFSSYYKDSQVINEDNVTLSQERLNTVLAVKQVLGEGLKLLGIDPLEKM